MADSQLSTTLYDSSGNGNTGKISSTGMWSSSAPPGGASAYLQFDGVSQYVHSVPGVSYSSNQIITLDFWAFCSDWSQPSYLFITPSLTASFLVYVPSGASRLYTYIGDSAGHASLYYSSTTLTNSVWLHMQIVFNNTNGTIQQYVTSGGDIATVAGSTWTTPTAFASQIMTIGQGFDYYYFTGSLALIKIFAGDTHTL
jgi:hypothetical protein